MRRLTIIAILMIVVSLYMFGYFEPKDEAYNDGQAARDILTQQARYNKAKNEYLKTWSEADFNTAKETALFNMALGWLYFNKGVHEASGKTIKSFEAAIVSFNEAAKYGGAEGMNFNGKDSREVLANKIATNLKNAEDSLAVLKARAEKAAQKAAKTKK